MSEEMSTRQIPLDRLVAHPMNANLMSAELREKLCANISRSRHYPPLVVRPLPDGRFQILDGHVRAGLLAELGETAASCVVWEVDEQEALVLLATLNRLEGEDVPARRAALIVALAEHDSLAELARLLPESEATLQASLDSLNTDLDQILADLTEQSQRVASDLPVLFSFAVDRADAPLVEEALGRAAARRGHRLNKRQTLVELARSYLQAGRGD